MDPLTEYVVRNYRIAREVGGDGYCRYFQAEAGSGDGHVTVAVLRPLSLDPAFPGRFQAQLDRACALSHPGLLPILHFSRDQQGYYVVMGQCPGQTLQQQVLAGPLPPSEALEITAGLAAALEYLHRSGFVHGALHPNAVFCTMSAAHLAPPGVARAVDPIALAAGSAAPEYLAPEQIAGRPADGRSDLYSLGLLLRFMVTGEHPAPWHPESPAPLPTGIEAVDALLAGLLQPVARQRLRNAGQLRSQVASARSGGTVQPVAPAPEERAVPGLAVVGPTGRHAPRTTAAGQPAPNAEGLGIAAFREGNLQEAIRLLRLAARSAPRSVRVLGYLGSALYQAGRYRDAAAVFAKAVQMRPESGRLRYNLGNALLACGEHNAALVQFQMAWDKDPRCTAAALALTQLVSQAAGDASA